MLHLLIILIGILIGSIVTLIFLRFRKKAIGTIRIDTSDPNDNPYLFLELDVPIKDFRNKKEVTCKINNKSYISQD